MKQSFNKKLLAGFLALSGSTLLFSTGFASWMFVQSESATVTATTGEVQSLSEAIVLEDDGIKCFDYGTYYYFNRVTYDSVAPGQRCRYGIIEYALSIEPTKLPSNLIKGSTGNFNVPLLLTVSYEKKAEADFLFDPAYVDEATGSNLSFADDGESFSFDYNAPLLSKTAKARFLVRLVFTQEMLLSSSASMERSISHFILGINTR